LNDGGIISVILALAESLTEAAWLLLQTTIMAAIHAAFALNMIPPGRNCVTPSCLYGGAFLAARASEKWFGGFGRTFIERRSVCFYSDFQQ
jgi:hypothetical protein